VAGATVTNSGVTALAQAIGTGSTGTATANAGVQGVGTVNVGSVIATASTPTNGAGSAQGRAANAVALPSTVLPSPAEDLASVSYATESPLAGDVMTLQSGRPNNQAVFAPNGSLPVAVTGLMGTMNLTGTTETNTSELTVNFVKTVGDIKVGVLDPSSEGNGFDSLTLTIIAGANTLSKTFTSLAAADTFFNDQVLDFAGNANGITIEAAETSSTTDEGFAFNVEVGATLPVVVPEPSALGFVAFGLGVLGWIRLARHRRAAAGR
jgi:hypothetical protein